MRITVKLQIKTDSIDAPVEVPVEAPVERKPRERESKTARLEQRVNELEAENLALKLEIAELKNLPSAAEVRTLLEALIARLSALKMNGKAGLIAAVQYILSKL